MKRNVSPALIFMIIVNDFTQGAIFFLGFILAATLWWGATVNRIQLAPSFLSQQQATGIIQSVSTDKISTGSRNAGRKRIHIYTYTFSDRAGVSRSATYFAQDGDEPSYLIGDRVPIAYLTAFPSVTEITGLPPAHVPEDIMIGTIAMTFFFGVGTVLLVMGLRKGLRQLYLLRYGELVFGKLLSKEIVKSGSIATTRFDAVLTYEGKSADGAVHRVTLKQLIGTGGANAGLPKNYTLDAPEETYILFDPEKPDKSLLAKDFNGSPRFDQPDAVYSGRPALVLAYLILPALVIGGHAVWALLRS